MRILSYGNILVTNAKFIRWVQLLDGDDDDMFGVQNPAENSQK